MPPARVSRGGSSFEGKRAPGSALDHERGGQAGSDEFDAGYLARRCTGRKPRAARTVPHAAGPFRAPPGAASTILANSGGLEALGLHPAEALVLGDGGDLDGAADALRQEDGETDEADGGLDQ